MNEANSVTAKNRIKTSDIVMTGVFTAIISVIAQLVIPIQPIPFSLVLFGIFLTGALLSPRYAFLSVLIYLILGACGVPVFAGLQGGLGHLTGPTGGFLASFPIVAFVTAIFAKYFKKYKVISLAIGMVISLFLCYLIGTLWFVITTGNSLYSALLSCVIPFVLFDLIKIVLAISVSLVLNKTIMKSIRA